MRAAVYALFCEQTKCPPPAQKRTSRKSVTPCGFLLCCTAVLPRAALGEARLLDSGALLLCVSRELYARCSLTACLLGARLLGARLLPLGSAPQRLAFIRLVPQRSLGSSSVGSSSLAVPHRSAPHRSALIARLFGSSSAPHRSAPQCLRFLISRSSSVGSHRRLLVARLDSLLSS